MVRLGEPRSIIEPPSGICYNLHIRCDERFVGYGGNKAACLFEMYLAGVSYYVLADHFIIHQNHLYEELAREHEVCLVRLKRRSVTHI